jgi:hypothetical protein
MPEQVSDRSADGRAPAGMLGGAGLIPCAPVGLNPGWRCLPGAVIRAHGEEGPVDLAALHPAHGVALIAFLNEGEEASPEEAREALRAMLHDEGLPRLFPGELPIVALPVPLAARAQLAGLVERAFAAIPAPTLPAGWLDWLTERLAAKSPAPAGAPRLLAPRRDEPPPQKVVSALLLTAVAEPVVAAATPRLTAPRRDEPLGKAAGGIILARPLRTAAAPVKDSVGDDTPAPSEPLPIGTPSPANWLDWGALLGFALGMGAALIAGLAAVMRNGRLF